MSLKHNYFHNFNDSTEQFYQILKNCSVIVNTIIYNDLIKRYKIRKEVIFKKIVNFILKSNLRIVSARNIHAYLKREVDNISLNTVLKYIEYLKEAYIIDVIPHYSLKAKRDVFICVPHSSTHFVPSVFLKCILLLTTISLK